MQKKQSKSIRQLLILAVLGGAAVFAVYYLYFRPPDIPGSREIVARQIDTAPSTTISSKVTYRFSEEEKKAVFNRTIKTAANEAAPPEPVSTVPGITFVPGPEALPPSSDTTAMAPSPLEMPQARVDMPQSPMDMTQSPAMPQDSNTVEGPAAPEAAVPAPAPPASPVQTISETDTAHHLVSDDAIPAIKDTGTERPVTSVLAPEDEKAGNVADISAKKEQDPATTSGVDQNSATPTAVIQPDHKPVKKTPPEAPASTAVASTKPGKKLGPSEKMNHFSIKTSKPRSLKDTVWVVNVLSTQNEKYQREVFKALSHYPYRVYTYTTVVKGHEWKRIRIGFFTTREEAVAAGEKLSRKHKLPQPWIVQPGPEEMEKFYLE